MIKKEEYAIILDYLPYGYPLEGKMMPLAQAIGETNFTLLQLIPRKGTTLQIMEKVYIGEGKRDKIYYILGRLPKEKLTENAKLNIEDFVKNLVVEKEKDFISFFNYSQQVVPQELEPALKKLKNIQPKLIQNIDTRFLLKDDTAPEKI